MLGERLVPNAPLIFTQRDADIWRKNMHSLTRTPMAVNCESVVCTADECTDHPDGILAVAESGLDLTYSDADILAYLEAHIQKNLGGYMEGCVFTLNPRVDADGVE